MRRLVYVSTARLGLEATDLKQIMNASVTNNRALGVTGVLLFNGRNFFQALEGPEQELRRLFDKIGADARHDGVKVILDEEIAASCYPAWGMKLQHISLDERHPWFASNAFADTLIERTPADIRKMLDALASLA